MTTVFIDGDQGTTGLRLRERLKGRKDLSLLALPEERRKSLPHRAELAAKADVAFLCLPDEASRELVAALPEEAGALVDTSTAHRTSPGFAYGFPELGPSFARALGKARRIAVPGCHATGAVALLYPLVRWGALSPDTAVSLASLTGYSGGGKAMIARYEDPSRPGELRAPLPYALGQNHKHLPEITKVCGLAAPPLFQPMVCDFYSGMLVSLPLPGAWLQKPLGPRGLTELYRDHYGAQPLLRVTDLGPEESLSPLALSGTDGLEVFVTGNEERMVAYARFDNLGKGASGAAIQCMNLYLGLPQEAGLVAPS